MFKLITKILGRKYVMLKDFDGQISIRRAYTMKSGKLWAYDRFGRIVILNPDGTVTGASYITGWEEK